MTTEVAKGPFLRERFPILKRWNYLCSHSLGAVPEATSDSLQRYYQQWAELGISAWDGPWWQAMEEFCELMETVLGAEPQNGGPHAERHSGHGRGGQLLRLQGTTKGGGHRTRIHHHLPLLAPSRETGCSNWWWSRVPTASRSTPKLYAPPSTNVPNWYSPATPTSARERSRTSPR